MTPVTDGRRSRYRGPPGVWAPACLAALLQLAGLASGADGQDRVIKIQHGEVVFHDATKVGETLLRRGLYRVEHRDSHVVVLTEQNWVTSRAVIWRPNKVRLELRGDLEALAAPAARSEVHVIREGRGSRVRRILFQGEATAHVFRGRPKEEP